MEHYACKKVVTFSAPSSPSKSGMSVYSQVQGITKNLMHAASGGISYNQTHRGNYKTVLIIDDEPVDWFVSLTFFFFSFIYLFLSFFINDAVVYYTVAE